MAAKQIAEKLITDYGIAVFSKSYCPYCTRAKQVISTLAIDQSKVGVMELDQTSEGGEVQAYLAQKTGQRTVPNIFVKGQHLGGCDDLMRASQSGELNKLVASL